MTKSITLLILFLGLFPANVFSQSQEDALRDAEALCNRVAEINTLPHKEESGVDATHDALVKAGDAVVPCLIEKITDTTIMSDPRCPVFSTETKIGDVAYFVLVRITGIGFTELFPSDVQEEFKTEGVYAYHDYFEREGMRKQLQLEFEKWYQKKQSAKT